MMMTGTPTRLSALQRTFLECLADQDPRWTLLGGAAPVGVRLFE